MNKSLSQESIDSLFREFYLMKEKIISICGKYGITRYQFYKLKKQYPKKSFYDYTLKDWVDACLKQDPSAKAVDICKYLSYVNKTDYSLEEIERLL